MSKLINTLDNFALRGVATLAGVQYDELKDLRSYDPPVRRVKAMEILGLTPDELSTIQEMRRITPINWSLKRLQIPESEYLDIIADRQNQIAVQRLKNDEFPDVLDKQAGKLLKQRQVSIRTFSQFLSFITKRYKKEESPSSEWKKAPALNHVKQAKRLLDQMITKDELSLSKVYRVIQFMYFAVFVSVMGHSVDTTPQEKKIPGPSRSAVREVQESRKQLQTISA